MARHRMLTPTAIPTEPTLLPIAPAPAGIPPASGGEMLTPGASAGADPFAAVLGTLLNTPSEGAASTTATATPGMPLPVSVPVAPMLAPPDAGAGPVPTASSPVDASIDTAVIGQDADERVDADLTGQFGAEGADVDESAHDADKDGDADDARARCEDAVIAAGWMFSPPPPPPGPVAVTVTDRVTPDVPADADTITATIGSASVVTQAVTGPAIDREAPFASPKRPVAAASAESGRSSLRLQSPHAADSTDTTGALVPGEAAVSKGERRADPAITTPGEPQAGFDSAPGELPDGSIPRAQVRPTPAEGSVAYQARGDNLPVSQVARRRAFTLDTPAAEVSAHFAGKPLPAGAFRVARGEVAVEKTPQVAGLKRVEGAGVDVGIEPANHSSRMPEELSPSPTPTEWLPTTERTEAPASHAPAAVRAVEKVVEVADMLTTSGRDSVQLRLDFGDGGPLTVHVSLRDGEVHAVFRSDSAEVREALSAAWDHHAAARGEVAGRVPLAEPEILPLRETAAASPASSSSSLQSQTDAHSGQRQHAPGHPASEFAPSRPRGTTADTVRNSHANTSSTPAPSTSLLSAFA